MTAQLFKLPAKSRSRSTKSYQLRVELKGVKATMIKSNLAHDLHVSS
jgi:hypothetical protein